MILLPGTSSQLRLEGRIMTPTHAYFKAVAFHRT